MDSCNKCDCKKRNHSWIVLAAIALLVILLLLFLPTTAFIGLFSTAAQTPGVGAIITFNGVGPADNITFTAPSTATLGANAGGTYLVSYDVSLINATQETTVNNTFAVFVNGVLQPSTAAGITLAVGATGHINMASIIRIPEGAAVTLVNVGPDAAHLNNTIGGVTIVSADLNLNRVGA